MVPRLLLYGITSTALAAAVISSALNSRPNFFSAAVSVGRSSGSLIVLANFVLFNVICFGIVVKTVFFGQLRAIEYEHLFERLWLFLTESLLALTIFRDDFSISFAALYGILLFLKCFHWITADRVDYMDQIPPPGPPPTFHLRLTSILLLLLLADFTLVTHCCESILENGVSSKVLFASEFLILLASIGGTVLRYHIGTVDIRRARGRVDAPAWEEKSMWLFYVDLGVDFVKLLTYLGFFTIILLHYGVPLHILRDVYMTLKSFLSRCADLVRYRRATRDMDALYPSATAEEMERLGDKTCIICREEMVVAGVEAAAGAVVEGTGQGEARAGVGASAGDGRGGVAEGGGVGVSAGHGVGSGGGTGAGNGQNDVGPNETPKKLACGHVFHFHCLRSWLERQQKCPTCRRDVLVTPVPPTRTGAAPPPAAPGAVPIPPPAAAPLDPIQTVFNEYFRQHQQPPRAPPPPSAPTADPQASSSSNTVPSHISEEDRRIQTGIWGGPITPGTFFATPLGAAPRSTAGCSALTIPLAGPSRLRIPPRQDVPLSEFPANLPVSARPNFTSTPPPGNTDTQPTETVIQPERSIAVSTTDIPQTTPTLASGSTTPFSSNPPQVFSSTGTARDDVGLEGSVRRQAAEAAMRRLGLGATASNGALKSSDPGQSGSAIRHSSISPPIQSQPLDGIHTSNAIHTSIQPQPSESTVESTDGSSTVIRRDKGKGKASQVDEGRSLVYLSGLHEPERTRVREGVLLEGVMAEEVKERLRVLMGVEERIWGVMEDLMNMSGQWDGRGEEYVSRARAGRSRGGGDNGGVEGSGSVES